MDVKLAELIDQFQTRAFLNWNAMDILALARKAAKQEEALQIHFATKPTLRIAITGSCNTQYFTMALRLYAYAFQLLPEIYETGYNATEAEIYNEHSALYQFDPDIVIGLTTWRDIQTFPSLLSSASKIQQWSDAAADQVLAPWRHFQQRSNAHVFLSNFALPARHLLGSMEANLPASHDNLYRELNFALISHRPQGMDFIDMESLSADFGKNRWFDEPAWFMGKLPFALDAIPTIAYAVTRQLLPSAGIIKKCLVLDLDHTLWGGVIGDDGLDGIQLDPNDAVGESYLDFHQTLIRLQERGVLLAVCSKNEEAIARSVFSDHPFCRLKLHHFAAFFANWEPKSVNLLHIAQQLNINPDALVFFDDNPAEREEVRMALPMVEVIDVPADPALFSRTLCQARCFETTQLSQEDLNRTTTFQMEQARETLAAASQTFTEYLRALEMRSEIGAPSEGELARFSQLINKTNQFNLRTQRYGIAEIQSFSSHHDTILLRATLTDQFSQYGLISALIAKMDKNEKTLWIDTWVMSCRVFNRELEYAIFNVLVDIARQYTLETIRAEYIPTPKNAPVQSLLPNLGFQKQGQKGDTIQYEFHVENAAPFHTTIKVNE